MFIRKINFITLMVAFNSIAQKSWKNENIGTYDKIPFNEECLKDIVIRNLSLVKNGEKVPVDLAVKLNEVNIGKTDSFYIKSAIEDIGDLSVFYGYEDHDFSGMTVEYGKTFPKKFNSLKEIEKIDFYALYEKGFTNVLVKNAGNKAFCNFPINIVRKMTENGDKLMIEYPANLVFRKNGSVKYVMINGFLVNIKGKISHVRNGLIYC